MQLRSALAALALALGNCYLASAATPSDAATDFLDAKLLAADGHLEEALALLDRSAAVAPNDGYLQLERARLLAMQGRMDEASRAIAAARSLAPHETEVLRQQGRIEMSRLADDPAAAETAKQAWEGVRAASPDDLEALVALGQLYLADEQPALASEVLEEAHRLRPDHPWIESLRNRALAATGDRSANETIQRRALDLRPEDLRTRFELAENVSAQGRHAEAAEILAAAPGDQRADVELRYRLARQLFLAGDPDSALAELSSVVAAHPESPAPRLLLARIDLALGYFDGAERALEPLADESSGDALIAELRIRALEGLGRVDEAVAILRGREQAARRAGSTVEADNANLEIARLWAGSGRWSAAVEAADAAAASADPELAERADRLALRARVESGRIDEALARAAEAPPQRAGALRLEILLRGGRWDEASHWIAAQGELEPERSLQIGGLLQDAERFAEALPMLQRAARAAPASREAQFRLATCLERLGRHDESVAIFRDIVERSPLFAPALNYLGYLWIEQAENLEEAVRMVGTAVRLDPDNGAYVDSLGWGYFRLGRREQALPLLERAARLLPGDATVLEHLGDALAATGELSRARDAYARALAAGSESASELERKLAQLSGDS